jgi:signal peptidase II
MTVARPWRAPVLIALVVVLLDQLTKHWAVNRLSDGRIIEVVWTLQFNLAFNSGMAFSRGQGMGPYIAVVATLVIVWLLVSLRSGGTKLGALGMGLLIGGAAGNLVDRMFRGDAWLRGSVVDFIDFQWFPIFNIADIAVNVGAGLLILNSILVSRSERDADSGDVESGGADPGDDGVAPTYAEPDLESPASDPDRPDYRKESR